MTEEGRSHDGSRNMNPGDLGFWALVAEDYRTHDKDILAQGFWALFWHRFGNWRMSVRPRVLRIPLTLIYRVMTKFGEWCGGIFLPYTVIVGIAFQFMDVGLYNSLPNLVFL